ncbi:MAG: FitA-like ribbon-helix-helix domain-containing protein [Marmoricola sp.]
MSKIIQIRDVPDDVRDALAEAAEAHGLSLTRYLRRELEHLVKRPQVTRENAAVIRQTQAAVAGHVDRDMILSALHDGRRD